MTRNTQAPEGAGVRAPHPPVSTFIAKALLRTGAIVVSLVWLSSCGALRAESFDLWWWPPITLLGAFSVHTALGVAGLAGTGLIFIGVHLWERSKR